MPSGVRFTGSRARSRWSEGYGSSRNAGSSGFEPHQGSSVAPPMIAPATACGEASQGWPAPRRATLARRAPRSDGESAVSPFSIFDPSTALDPNAFTGPAGPVMLVFALFWAPVGPGIPAGVLLARHIPLSAPATFGLYTLSDVLAALVCHPLFVWLRRHGRRLPPLRWLGRRMLALATFGIRLPTPADVAQGRRLAPALFRVATVGFGADVYTGGVVATGLALPRVRGWAAAIAGDLVWFACLLGTSIAAASVVDDDRVVGLAVLVAMFVIPPLARRIFPALRDEPRA